MKSIFVLFFLALLFPEHTQANSFNQPSGEVKIKWLKQGQLEKAAMLLPVHLEGDTAQYFMQLDVGAYHTVFYKNSPRSKRLHIGTSVARLDTLRKVEEVEYIPAHGIIGTIGLDLIEKTSITLDFQRDVVLFGEDLSAQNAAPFYYMHHKILFPVTLDGAQKMVCYDSGTSAFDFVTDQSTWDAIRDPDADALSFPVNSWGREVTVHLTKAKQSMMIGGATLTIDQVAYVEGVAEENAQQMINTGMQGMIGNTIFEGAILCMDFRSQQFTITR